MVVRIGDAKLVAASPQERDRLGRIAAAFSEEDLTRYLQLSLDLFGDLQESLQPRFHLELGLLRMVQAGRLISIEEALANLGAEPPAPRRSTRPPERVEPALAAPKGPSLFEVDRAKKATSGPVEAGAPPASGAEWKEQLHAKLIEIGMPFTADAIGHSSIEATAAELSFTTPDDFLLAMKADDINRAVSRIVGRPLKIRVVAGKGSAPEPGIAKPAADSTDGDETRARALANPEVKRFQEAFPGGQVRTVRNLKE